MFPFIRISQNSWTSFVAISLFFSFASGCVSRAPSLRMLDTRSGYGSEWQDDEIAMYERGQQRQERLASRASPRVAKVYIYPHELPTKDYFLGGYVSLLVAKEDWSLENAEEEDALEEPAIKPVTKSKNNKTKLSPRSSERVSK